MLARLAFVLLLAGLGLSPFGDARAQEQANTNRATDLKDRPAFDARTVAPLAADTAVSVISRHGAWTQVETGARQRGWVRAFHLRFRSTVEAAPSGSGGALGGLTSMFSFGSREAPKTSRVATLGIRGLSPEDFKNAAPDPAALQKLQSFRADKAAAERFAREAKLAAVAVAYAKEGGGS